MYFMKFVSKNSTCNFSDIKVDRNKRYWLPCCKYLVQVNPSNRISLYLISVLTGSGSGDVFVGQRLRHWSGGPTPRPGGRGMMGYTWSASCDKGNNSKQLKLTDHLYKAVPLLTDVSVIKCVFKMTLYTSYVLFVWNFWHSINKLLNKTLWCCWQVYYQKFIRRSHHRLEYRQLPHNVIRIMMFMWYIMYHDIVVN